MARRVNQSPPQLPKRFASALEFPNLTPQEQEDINERARQKVAEERKAAEEDQCFEQALRTARSAYDPALRMEDVLIDLPGHAVHILIDGVQFMHGMVYEVPQPVAQTINDIIHRTWLHEDEIGGANRAFYQKPRDIKLTRRSQNITTAHLMRS
jgi:hypothetical protein